MRSHSKRIHWILFLTILLMTLGVATPVLADYLGPNRTVTQTISTCHMVLYKCQKVKNNWKYKRAEDWSCSNESKPWEEYSSGGSCNASDHSGQRVGREENLEEVTITHPSATVASSLQNCTLQNGWCGVTTPELFLSANEPLSGYNILIIEGTLAGQTFACQGSSCSMPLIQGYNNFVYWAISSWGDSSEMGMLDAWVDTVPPDLGLDISGATGANGWYVSPTVVTAISSDATSGIWSALLSVDNVNWQPSMTLNEGVHNVAASALDNAGNISNASSIISVDTTTPSINMSIDGTVGKNGWYKSNILVSGLASDATSGVAVFEVSADGSVYQSYTTPIPFSDGYHTIQFKAIDNAGNTTETPLQEFYIDTIAPAVKLPGLWQLGRNVPYDVQDNGSGLAALRLVIEDEDEHYAKVAWSAEVSGTAYSEDIDWNGEFRDGTTAPPGTYLVWIKANDIAGNEHFELGKVIVPESNVALNLFQPEVATAMESVSVEVPVPPEDLFEAEETPSSTTPPILHFGSSITEVTEITTHTLFLTSGTAATIPNSSSNVLWGAAAAAAIGAATAYAVEATRKRKEAEAEQAERVAQEMAAGARRRARRQQKQRALDEARQQILEQQRLEEERRRQAAYNARIEKKLTRLEAEDEAKWVAAQIIRQKRAEEEKKKVEQQHAGLETYRNSERQAETTIVTPPKEKSKWEKLLDWTDEHQTEIALVLGVGVGLLAVVLSGGLAIPVVTAVIGATVAAGVLVGAGTVALNTHYDRPWHENLLQNVALAGGAALITSTAGFLIPRVATKLSTGVSSYCAVHQSTCARVEPFLNAWDKGEEIWLQGKLAYQTWRGDEIGAIETAIDLHSEYVDGGMPGNVVAKKLGDQFTDLGKNVVPVIKTYGNDVIPLLVKHGDEGLAFIQKFGRDGIELLRKYGNDATDLVYLDKDVLDYVMQQGDDAVEALSRWSAKDLREHGLELALRAKKDAGVLADIKKLTSSGPIDPKNLTEEQKALIEAIAANSTQYAENGQVVLGKWVDISGGFVQTAQNTGSFHYNPHPDMWTMLGKLGNAKQEEVAWLINKQVVQNGIDKGLPFEYTLNGIPADKILYEKTAVDAIFAGATDEEIMDILDLEYMPIRMKELQELQKAEYEITFDSVNESYILVKGREEDMNEYE